jgi:hypothetical protein
VLTSISSATNFFATSGVLFTDIEAHVAHQDPEHALSPRATPFLVQRLIGWLIAKNYAFEIGHAQEYYLLGL